MNTKHIFKAGLFSLLAATAACTADDPWTGVSDVPGSEGGSEVRRITMDVDDFVLDDTDTRVNIGVSSSGLNFTWSAGDVVGVFPGDASSVYQTAFPVRDGAGTKTAVFDGYGWRLKKAKDYVAYFPCVQNLDVRSNAVPVDYTGQHQTADKSTAHMSQHDFLYAPTVQSDAAGEKVNFKFSHLGCLVQIAATLPEGAGAIKTFELNADADVLVAKGTVDLTQPTPSITATSLVNTLTYDVDNLTADASGVLTLYLMMAPVDLTGRELVAILTEQGGKKHILRLTTSKGEPLKAMRAGGAYRMKTEAAKAPRFITTTITNAGTPSAAFAPDTQWYTIQVGTDGWVLYNTTESYVQGYYMPMTYNYRDIHDESQFWCFVGNETDGYKLYNKQAGARSVLAAPTNQMSSRSNFTHPLLTNEASLGGKVCIWHFDNINPAYDTPTTKYSEMDEYAYMYLHNAADPASMSWRAGNARGWGRFAFDTKGDGPDLRLHILPVVPE